MRQHGFAGDVADGPDVAHRGPALLVDLHGAAVHVQVQGFQVPAGSVGVATDGDQHLVGLDHPLCALNIAHAQAVAARFQAHHAVAEVELDAQLA
ncbi:hypothetical protein D9M73_243250 [compost metagenome]